MIIKFSLEYFGKAEDEGRTEQATSKKRDNARKEGQVAKSQDLNTAAILLSFFIVMQFLGSYYVSNISRVFYSVCSQIVDIVYEFELTLFLNVLAQTLLDILLINSIIFLTIFSVSFFVAYRQVGWKPTSKPFEFKLNKFNPIKGLQKLVSLESLFKLGKSILILVFLVPIYYSVIIDEIPIFFKFANMSVMEIANYIADVIVEIGISISVAYFAIAIADYIYQKHKHEQSIKMTKHDIKEEHKQAEGDPLIKNKIRQKMRQMSMQRMMQAVPEADVIITNPTHFAVAIYYDKENSVAPVVVAKGMDKMALKIKEVAKENKVEIVENKLLARTLYYSVEIDSAIPPELYQAVAEVLAFVYQLKNKK
ncbi:MAG: flagellar biosynthesis protein FlhB [Epulopiscium sp. Nuni2H_MBin003]|nr:MAG: flagellar biosynthesis protein FlhB [Epulopiscium sp. Nuni2H_MBin003]